MVRKDASPFFQAWDQGQRGLIYSMVEETLKSTPKATFLGVCLVVSRMKPLCREGKLKVLILGTDHLHALPLRE